MLQESILFLILIYTKKLIDNDREETEKPKNGSDIIDDEDVITPIADWLNLEKDATNKDSLNDENDNSFRRLMELSSQWNDEVDDEDEA